jgi:hypothetical protein
VRFGHLDTDGETETAERGNADDASAEVGSMPIALKPGELNKITWSRPIRGWSLRSEPGAS